MDYVRNFYAGYRDLLDNKSDPRTSEWFLMSSPLPTAAICITYAYCVKVGENFYYFFIKLLPKSGNSGHRGTKITKRSKSAQIFLGVSSP